jgi:hypothetical protein
MRSKPIGVIVIAIFYFIAGVGSLLSAIWALMATVDTSRIPFVGADMAKYILLVAVVLAAIGAGYVATGWGLWQMRQWAQAAAITVAILSLVPALGMLVLMSMGGVPWQLLVVVGLYAALEIGIIAYLFMPSTAAMFSNPATMPSQGQCPHCFRSGIGPDMTVCPYCRQSLFAPSTPPDYFGGNYPEGGVIVSGTTSADGPRLQPTKVAAPTASVLAWLVVKAGPDAGSRLDLVDDTAIGRDAHCQISLRDDYVSRQHARVKLEGGQFVIYDVGSATGTFVNGRKVQRLMLYDGVEIRLGNTTLEFKKTAPAR